MVIYAKIRRMFFREHLSISEIARRTSLTRNTIKKWLKAADGSEPRYRRSTAITKLTPFEPKLLMALGQPLSPSSLNWAKPSSLTRARNGW